MRRCTEDRKRYVTGKLRILRLVLHRRRSISRRSRSHPLARCRSAAYRKENTVWWVLGWIFIFPVPLTILILRSKTLKPVLKVLIIALAWIVYIAIAESADEEEKNTDGDEKASVEMKELSEACAEESILDTEFCL